MSKLISLVIPCYNSAQSIRSVVAEIISTVSEDSEHTYEIILVDDHSPDDTFAVIQGICQTHGMVRAIRLAKNFGQHSALMAGFHYASGDYIICLDDDGQTPPAELPKLISVLDGGHDVVYAKYAEKKHSAFRNTGSRLNSKMAEMLMGKPKELFISSYFGMQRFIKEEIIRYTNPYAYVIGLILRSTSDIVNVTVEHRARTTGSSGYSFGKLLRLWLNGFTAFSVKPLRIATAIGSILAVIGFFYFIYTILNRLINPASPMGWSSLMAVLLIIGGAILLVLGMVGEYIGRSYISLNKSPQFVVRETIHIASNDGGQAS